MKRVAILGVPMDLGAGRRGVDMGPSALRLARLERELRKLGLATSDLGNIDVPVAEAAGGDPGDRAHFVSAIAETCRQAYRRLRELPDTHLPLTLGGDHSISMATVAGAAGAGRTGVVWVDAHADLNTPDTSPSQNIHGMPLAHLLGLGDPTLLDIWGGGAVIRPEDVVYVGLRSVDPGERALIHELGIRAFTMTDVDRLGVAAVAAAALAHLAGVARLHVSFDADALDPHLAPGVGTPVQGGLTYREAHLLMELLAESGLVTSVDLVEVNPILDVQNRTARLMVELAASLLGKRIL